MWLPIIMIAWGGVMVSICRPHNAQSGSRSFQIGMGFVDNFVDLFVTRIFLGITEAGLFPGVSFFLTQWYKRYGQCVTRLWRLRSSADLR